MLRPLLFFVCIAIVASQVPYLMRYETASPDIVDAPQQTMEISVAPGKAGGGSVLLSADARGHFRGNFKLNGKTVEGMIDTGASSIAINETTARRLGFTGNALDYRHSIGTANGTTKAALVRLERVEIGAIRVRNVDAMVLKDESLSGTLIGMTFLKRLSAFQVEGSSMRLTP
ncbi:TIGR02281 family clan AA aspartic protease [Rhizobium helianthi]|uniref:TIGR02281 family clan AA aspartic protease n=1 Tax=Rhizobium helianthi TaxID=1132695 RepID=A0ABW4M020_9HYPH